MGSSGHPREGRLHWRRSVEQQLRRHRSRSPRQLGLLALITCSGHVSGTEFLPGTADEKSVSSDCPRRAQVGPPHLTSLVKLLPGPSAPLSAGRPPLAQMASPGALQGARGLRACREGALSKCSGPCSLGNGVPWGAWQGENRVCWPRWCRGAECSRCESGCLAFSPNQRAALPTSHWAATFSPLAGASAQHLHVHLTHSGQSSLRESLRGRGGLSPGPHNARPLFFHSPHPGPIPSRPVLPPPSPSRCLACLCTRGQASLTSCPNYCELLSLLSLRAGPTCSHSGHCWPGGT